jgi:hypothetical protein
MHVNLKVAGLWDVINKGTSDYRNEKNTLVALLCAVPQEMQASLTVKESAKEA